jgi:hypothetical protein
VDTVVGYLKEHLPAPIASQLDGAMSGQGAQGQGQGQNQGQGQGMMDKAKGMLGGGNR